MSTELQWLERERTIPEPLRPGEAAPGALRVEVHEDPASFARLENGWRKLACPSCPCDPFMQIDWIKSWWHAFGGNERLRLVTAWQGDRLVGVLPLMLGRVRRYGIPVRRLGALVNVHSPRLDLICAQDVEGVVDTIWHHVIGTAGQWDILELPRMLSDSPTLERLVELSRSAGLRARCWQAERSPYIETTDGWSNYLAGRSKNFRKALRRKKQRLSRMGQLSLEVVSHPVDVPAALREGLEIEADGWKGRTGTAILSNDRDRTFYEALALNAAAVGALRLHFLKLDDTRIAFDFSLRYANRVYSLKSGYRNSHHEHSPGLVLLGLMLEHYMHSTVEEIDLLGKDDEFKKRWSRSTRSHQWLFCFAPTLRGRAVNRVKFGLIPLIKRMQESLISLIRPAR